jgi:hypothetical protein
MRFASLQTKGRHRNKINRQYAGFAEQHARAPVARARLTAFQIQLSFSSGSATIVVGRAGMLAPDSFARSYSIEI